MMNGAASTTPAISAIVHVDRERLAGHGVNELAAGRQHAADRLEDEVDDRIDDGERHEHADADGDRRIDDALANVLELFEHRELES